MASQGAARIGDRCGGSIISSRASSVFVNGRLVATRGSQVSPHSDHGAPPIVTSSSRVYSGGIGIAREGDKAGCSHTISGGSGNVRVG